MARKQFTKACPTCGTLFTDRKPTRKCCSRRCSAKRTDRRGTVGVRFMAKVVKHDNGCWVWTGGTARKGYGSFTPSTGKHVQAHRFSWELHHGPIPHGDGHHGTCVLHRCDNPPCVNPDHLFLGTIADNIADKVAKDRHTRGETHRNSKYSDDIIRQVRVATGLQREIADRFGMSQSRVSVIRGKKAWAHVTDQEEPRSAQANPLSFP